MLGYRVWTDTHSVGKAVFAPFTWVGETIRTVRGTQPLPDAELARLIEIEDPEMLAAIAIAKDTEGEEAQKRTPAMKELFDAMLRAKARGVSLDSNFRMAHTFMPLDWDHDAHMSRLATWTVGGWVKRVPKKTARTVPLGVLREALKIVRKGLQNGPDPSRCALYAIRPKNHEATRWDGEHDAREALRKMRKDPEIAKLHFRTDFRCPS